MKIDDKVILDDKEFLLDCLYSEQQLLLKYAKVISRTNIKNVALELNNFLIDEQGMCYELISLMEKLRDKENDDEDKKE